DHSQKWAALHIPSHASKAARCRDFLGLTLACTAIGAVALQCDAIADPYGDDGILHFRCHAKNHQEDEKQTFRWLNCLSSVNQPRTKSKTKKIPTKSDIK
ncbi:hypothetical protein ABTB07_20985, partial [Acinetobacter baumannii]